MARNDLLKAQLQQSNIELSLLEAENNFKITAINMTLMLGLPEGTDLLPDSTGLEATAEPGPITKWEQTAMEQRKVSTVGIVPCRIDRGASCRTFSRTLTRQPLGRHSSPMAA